MTNHIMGSIIWKKLKLSKIYRKSFQNNINNNNNNQFFAIYSIGVTLLEKNNLLFTCSAVGSRVWLLDVNEDMIC